jgi:ankyrin repeat protein
MLDSFRQWMSERQVNAALRSAVRWGHAEKARNALERGADPDQDATWGRGFKTGTPSLLLWAGQSGKLTVVQALLEYKADPDKKDHFNRTVAHLVAKRCEDDPEAMDALVLLNLLHPRSMDAVAYRGVCSTAWKELSNAHEAELKVRIQKALLSRGLEKETAAQVAKPRARL